MMKSLLVSLLILSALNTVEATETRQQYVYVLRPARIEMLTAGPTEREVEILNAHAAYLQKLTAEGTLLVGGRTLNNDASTIGLAIFLAPSLTAAEEIMKNDPVVKSGVMTATLYPYDIAFGTLASRK